MPTPCYPGPCLFSVSKIPEWHSPCFVQIDVEPKGVERLKKTDNEREEKP
jgi:hypothetical protein